LLHIASQAHTTIFSKPFKEEVHLLCARYIRLINEYSRCCPARSPYVRHAACSVSEACLSKLVL
jgi:hypothetical protein